MCENLYLCARAVPIKEGPLFPQLRRSVVLGLDISIFGTLSVLERLEVFKIDAGGDTDAVFGAPEYRESPSRLITPLLDSVCSMRSIGLLRRGRTDGDVMLECPESKLGVVGGDDEG